MTAYGWFVAYVLLLVVVMGLAAVVQELGERADRRERRRWREEQRR